MKDVKVYSTPTCPYCVRLKAYLDEKGIAYKNIDVSSNKQALDEMVKLTGQMGVPVTVVDKEVVIGFEKERIDSLIS